ncbi:MAG TPA: hypothetical protein VI409_06150 [Gaiellaceae bacterium]|nr:hypothetical protein [Gaiellaceae bacterium]
MTTTLAMIFESGLLILVAGTALGALCVLLPMGVIAALRLVESLANWSYERVQAQVARGAVRHQSRVTPVDRPSKGRPG